MNMAVLKSVAIATVTLLLAAQQCVAYKCYVCSWSPTSHNRTDICTRANFNKDAVKTFGGCPHGCEVVSAYDTNGELENFYRNCVVKGKKVTNDCREETNAAVRKTVCRCDSDLCNDAGTSTPTLLGVLAAAILTVSLALRG
ncbi:uncharacterized protein LOC119091260 [Pollicipes pollicipes]|uniref:uncharacterized protein LOC119091259 n=1 Tax=Pollicipes pollicipes TaxID=41117 RepID=UPI0018857F6F|nr:uncharacterized protein LOC119091259 [Pollicipes pollicipes]XP_037069824.1 uncharacterized protein LOC119091259 [Pollicipes pollicipes]XP_037069826.1 uncharacterized protein LOC119091260 [Pollicipes pollicipes]